MIPELEPIWTQFLETYAALRDALTQVPHDRLTWRPRVRPGQGSHELRFEAVDRLGNRATRAVPLEVD